MHEAAHKYDLPEKKALDKYTILCEKAIEIDEILSAQRYSNILYVVKLKSIPEQMDELRGKFGLFYEADLDNEKELCNNITSKVQTCVTYGIKNEKLAEFFIENNVIGVDRIVPIGEAMNIDLYWDGYDVISSMSRIILF